MGLFLSFAADPCASSPCLNGGTCIPSKYSSASERFECKCLAGYAGLLCERQAVDTCSLPKVVGLCQVGCRENRVGVLSCDSWKPCICVVKAVHVCCHMCRENRACVLSANESKQKWSRKKVLSFSNILICVVCIWFSIICLFAVAWFPRRLYMRSTSGRPADNGIAMTVAQGQSRRWYFNQVLGKCEMFMYSGCGGNMNNFPNKQVEFALHFELNFACVCFGLCVDYSNVTCCWLRLVLYSCGLKDMENDLFLDVGGVVKTISWFLCENF